MRSRRKPVRISVAGSILAGVAGLGAVLIPGDAADEAATGPAHLVKDINSHVSGGSSPARFVEFRGETFFIATATSAFEQLWKTDGTPKGTVPVLDFAKVLPNFSQYELPERRHTS